jgi:phosphopantetheinyl transferase
MSTVLLLVDLTGAPRDEGRRVAAALAAQQGAGAYSWTRSGDVGAFAWCDEGPIGVDLERIREIDGWPRIAAEFLDAETRSAIWRASDPLGAFFAAWTTLESRGKAARVGLAGPAPSLPIAQFRIEHRGTAFIGAVASTGSVPVPRWVT